MNDVVRIEIESLRKLKTGELRTRYRDVFGEASASFNREHLFRRIAWRLQAEAEGDLSERARQRASELANDSDVRLRAPESFWRDMAAMVMLRIEIRDCRPWARRSSASIKGKSSE